MSTLVSCFIYSFQLTSDRLHFGLSHCDDTGMSNHEDFDSKIKELRHRFKHSLPAKLRGIETGWSRLCTINWSQPLSDKLATVATQLAASGKTFGFGHLSIEARELSSLLTRLQEKGLPPNSHEKARISEKIGRLKLAAGHGDVLAEKVLSEVNSAANPPEVIYLVDSDSDYLRALQLALQKSGYQTQQFKTLASFYQALERQLPDMVCLDVVFPEGKQAGIPAVEVIRGLSDRKIPVLFVSSRSDMVARLKALRVGGDGYLAKPLEPDAVRDVIIDLLKDDAAKQILLIDGDKGSATETSRMLKHKGYCVEWIANPVETLAALAWFQPDLIITDYHMPHCNGLELAELLRQDERYMDIPILFLATEQNEEIQQRAHSITGNAFLSKPASEKHLLEAASGIIVKSGQVKSRLKLVRNRQLATSLVTRSYLFAELEMAIANVVEGGIVRHVLCIAIDRTDYLKRRFGLKEFSFLEEQIRDFLLKKLAIHLLVQMKEDLYLVMTNPMSADQALELAELICRCCAAEKFSAAGSDVLVSLSVGLTAVNHRIDSLEQCLSYSEEGCVIASQRGGNCVTFWPEPNARGQELSSLLEPRIMQAIENQSFKLVFQPVVNLDEADKLYECRVRLVDEDNNKELLPKQFLPYIEKHQLQFDLDRWVSQQALRSLTSLSGLEREEVNLIVKVTPESYQFGQIINYIANLVRNSKLKGQHRLFLQVDESWAIAHQDSLKQEVKRLKSVGIGFIVDHAGQSDYTPELMKDTVPTMIKLDMGLVAEFNDSEASAKKLSDLLGLANQSGVRVIAGTVEDAKVFASLWSMGVRYFQGYFIQQPGHSLDFDFQSFNYG